MYLSLYGEVQPEIIGATLLDEFGLDVTFRETTTICIERPAGAAFEIIAKEPNPFLATVGLRVEPAPVGAGVETRRSRRPCTKRCLRVSTAGGSPTARSL